MLAQITESIDATDLPTQIGLGKIILARQQHPRLNRLTEEEPNPKLC